MTFPSTGEGAEDKTGGRVPRALVAGAVVVDDGVPRVLVDTEGREEAGANVVSDELV